MIWFSERGLLYSRFSLSSVEFLIDISTIELLNKISQTKLMMYRIKKQNAHMYPNNFI